MFHKKTKSIFQIKSFDRNKFFYEKKDTMGSQILCIKSHIGVSPHEYTRQGKDICHGVCVKCESLFSTNQRKKYITYN